MKRILSLLIVLIALVIIPSKTFALTDSEIIESKEIIVKSVPVKNEFELFILNEYLYEQTEYSLTDCNSDFSKCSVYKGPDDSNIIATNVTVKYDYDKDIKEIVDTILKAFPSTGKELYVEDIYSIRWILDEVALDQVDENNEGLNPVKYSPDFNSLIKYNNFNFEPRAGDDTLFAHFQEATLEFVYDGTIYGFGKTKTRVNQVIYVNDDETDIEGAIKERLSKYFNVDKVIKDTDYTVSEMFADEVNYFKDEYNLCVQKNQLIAQKEAMEQIPLENRDDDWQTQHNQLEQQIHNINYWGPDDLDQQYASADEYANAMADTLTDEDSIDALWNLNNKVLPNVYVITFTDNDLAGIPVFVIKDSSKVVTTNLEVITRDVKSGITINNVGTSKTLPFNTLVQVAKLTSGSDYEKIIKTLESLINTDKAEMFDLKLFSSAIEDYITKLDDGSFSVKIPIDESLKDENLVVYYVDGNKTEEHTVKVENIDGKYYAVFNTDHFSIYTLSVKKTDSQPEESIINNPPTFDNITTYFVMTLISVLGLGFSIKK